MCLICSQKKKKKKNNDYFFYFVFFLIFNKKKKKKQSHVQVLFELLWAFFVYQLYLEYPQLKEYFGLERIRGPNFEEPIIFYH